MAESKKDRRGTSLRSGFASVREREKQAAVKTGGIPEERVGKKRAPASGRGEGTSANATREAGGKTRVIERRDRERKRKRKGEGRSNKREESDRAR